MHHFLAGEMNDFSLNFHTKYIIIIFELCINNLKAALDFKVI